MTTLNRVTNKTNPGHYRTGGKECIDEMPGWFYRWLGGPLALRLFPWISDYPGEHRRRMVTLMMVGFCLGNAFKYQWRAGRKSTEAVDHDEAKAVWYTLMARHQALPEVEPDPRDTGAAS